MVRKLAPTVMAALLMSLTSIQVTAIQEKQQQGQSAAQDQPVRLQSDLIEVRAVVTDKKGKVVEGLAKEDFEVLENGKSQPIGFFSMERVEGAPGGTQPAAGEVPKAGAGLKPQRTVVLLVDTLLMDFVDTSLVKPALKLFLDEQMTDGDMVAIVTTSGMLGVLEQFTSDRNMLRSAVERLRPFGWVDSDLAQVRQRHTLDVLQAAVERLAEMPGQRLLAFLSPGLPLREPAMATQLENITSRATRSGVVTYSIDSGGLRAYDPASDPAVVNSSSTEIDAHNMLNALAKDTGGDFYRNSNDLGRGVRKALGENRTFYALAYYPVLEAGDDKFRKIKVRVKGHPEYEVRAQRGYSPGALRKQAEKEQALSPEQRMTKAMLSPYR